MTLDMRITFVILRYNVMSFQCLVSNTCSLLEHRCWVGSELYMSTLWPCSECPRGWQTSQLWYSLDASTVLGSNQNHLQCLLWDLGETHAQCLDSQTCFPWDVSRQSASSVFEGGTTNCYPRTQCGPMPVPVIPYCLAQPSHIQSVCWGVYKIPSFWTVWISSIPSFHAYLFVCVL